MLDSKQDVFSLRMYCIDPDARLQVVPGDASKVGNPRRVTMGFNPQTEMVELC